MRFHRAPWVVLAAMLALPAHSAEPADVPAQDRAEITSVIERQIAAFRRDDADAAFAFAAPDIQALFGDSAHFMAMVRHGYEPVYRPRSVTMGDLLDDDGKLVQRVMLVGPDGRAALALYTMEHEADGSWRIASCVIVRPDTFST